MKETILLNLQKTSQGENVDILTDKRGWKAIKKAINNAIKGKSGEELIALDIDGRRCTWRFYCETICQCLPPH